MRLVCYDKSILQLHDDWIELLLNRIDYLLHDYDYYNLAWLGLACVGLAYFKDTNVAGVINYFPT